MTLRTRKRLALLVLVVGMPLYVVAAVSLTNWAGAAWGRLPFLAELAVYVGLGFVWILPFRGLFRGVGQPDPDSAGPKDNRVEGKPPERKTPDRG